MNHLIAEIKSRKKSDKTLKVFSIDDTVYPLPTDLNNPKQYDTNYKLEDDEWFHIPNFINTDYCIDLLKKDFVSSEFNQISKDQLENIKYLIAYQKHQEKEYYFFQKINPSQLLKKSWFKVSETPSLEKKSHIVIINDYADAIFSKSENILFFKKLNTITAIFRGISELYREATQEETESFLCEDFIKLEDDFDASHVGTANRKRIAVAFDTLDTFNDKDMTQIIDYIKVYYRDMPFDEDSKAFKIKDEEGLKRLLWGIDQRYYTTKIGNKKRVANSISPVE